MKKVFLKYWLPVIIWASVIFYFSHQPYLKSDLPGAWDFALRKTAHVTEYFILCLLLLRALGQQGAQAGLKQAIFWAVALSILYAVSDEFHQSFIAGRQPALRDIGFDSLGALLAAGLYYLTKKRDGNTLSEDKKMVK